MDLRKDYKAILSAIATGIVTYAALLEIAGHYGVSLDLPISLADLRLVLAFLGLTAFPLWLGYQLRPWFERIRRPAAQKMGVPRLLELVKDGGEMKVIGTEYSRWTEQSYETIKKRIIEKDVRFTFLVADPAPSLDPKCPSNLERAIASELIEEGSVEAIEASLKKFRNLRDSLDEKHREKIQIRLFDLPLTHSMAIAMPKAPEKAEAHIWPYLHRFRGEQRPYIIYESGRTEHRVMFEKCLESYQYVFENPRGDVKARSKEQEETSVTNREKEDFRNGVATEMYSLLKMFIDPLHHWDINYPSWSSKAEQSKVAILGKEDYLVLRALYDAIEERNRYFALKGGMSLAEVDLLNQKCVEAFSRAYSEVAWLKIASDTDSLLSKARKNVGLP